MLIANISFNPFKFGIGGAAYFLNGPVSTHPPPLPAGAKAVPLCEIFLPLPLMLESLPSKMGDFSGSCAHLPQSQY
jgi:hypothetical protein